MNSSNSWRVSNMSSCPKLRIEGFTDAWEQRKVSELLEERNEQAPESSDYPLMAFIANIGVAPKGERYDRGALVKDAENKLYKRTEIGDFIYSSNNLETGSIGLNNYGNACISPVYSIFKPTGIADSDFIGRRFIRKDFINSMVKWRQGVVYGQWKIHESDFMKIQIAVPSLEEQRKIGEFLSSLDNLITLHQRKSDALKNAKKYFLKNMFPSEGEKFPKLRLEGFTDAWEQRKLKDIASFIRGSFPQPYTNPDFYDENGGKPFVQVADIGMGLELNQDTKTHISRIAESKSRFVEAGTVIVALQGSIETSIGRTAITQYDAFVDRTILIFESYRIPIDKIFFAQSIKKLFQKEKEKAWGATISTITKEHLSDFILGIPSLDEQVKIGLFFKNIDNLITLHQRKCDALKNAKKFFLQNMFV